MYTRIYQGLKCKYIKNRIYYFFIHSNVITKSNRREDESMVKEINITCTKNYPFANKRVF